MAYPDLRDHELAKAREVGDAAVPAGAHARHLHEIPALCKMPSDLIMLTGLVLSARVRHIWTI